MATRQQQQQQSQSPHSHLPPSPPPSPPKSRQRRKKSTDPFLNLSSTPVRSPSPPSSPRCQSPEHRESLLKQILLTPLLMTSFLLSLFLINRRDRQRRHNHHSSSSSSLHTYFSYLSPRAWLGPEPYRDPGRGEGEKGEEQWFLTKKHRAMTRLEVGDALELREGVVRGMVAVAVAGVVGVGVGVAWVLGRWCG
ncbi:hypothetical protein AOQ84DRAFT_185675 [Glonium stellatum]|uniref:Uncharacterized protein n=1 Tax=Glonium stellatum TaxID=574774 RepID=A0A8E2JVV2_9PEZI|nr:hypothetical protein AOQ84DRAFT_185675 [Glonium stellatum]